MATRVQNLKNGPKMISFACPPSVDEDGSPRQFDLLTVRRKLGSIAKGKAPDLTGNGPDLRACQPDSWVEWAVKLCNITQHSQMTPRGWVASSEPQERWPRWPLAIGSSTPTAMCQRLTATPTLMVTPDESDGAVDEPSDGTHAAECSGVTAAVATAAGAVDYAVDRDGVEPSPRPTRRATRLLHRARQMVGTLRWWTMRWPTNAISLVARACCLDTESTYKLLRELRKESVTHVQERWLVDMDRGRAAENTLARNTTREQRPKLQRTLGRTRNRQHKLMPDWVTVKTKPL